MTEYRFIIVGNNDELKIIENAINTHLLRYYKAIPERVNSSKTSVTFSVRLSLLWGEPFEKVLNVALYRGLKNSGIMNSDSWLVDTL